MGLSAVAAVFADAELVGTAPLDWAWSAAFAGLAALAATRAKRGQLLAVSIIAALSVQSGPNLVLAVVAVIAAVLSTRKLDRRAVFARGLSGGLSVVCLLNPGGSVSGWRLAVSGVIVCALLGGSAWRNTSSRRRRGVVVGVGALFGVWLGATALAALGLASKADDLSVASSELRMGLASARRGEAEAAVTHLEAAQTAMRSARHGLERFGLPARAFPGSAQQVEAVTEVMARLERATTDARRAAQAVVGDRLAVRSGLLDLAALMELRTPLSRLSSSLQRVVEKIDDYEDVPLFPSLRDRLETLRVESWRAAVDAAQGSQAAAELPAALGSDGPKRYLVLFTTPVEARGRFGFPGSFAEVVLDHGRYLLGEHGAVSDAFTELELDSSRFDVSEPDVRPYVPFGATRAVQASTIPPDFRVVAHNVAEMWEQSGRAPLDGVLRFSPSALARMLALTGPVEVPQVPQVLTESTLEQFLLLGQYAQFPAAQAPRREVLETVSDLVFERLETADLPNPRTLFDLFAPAVAAGELDVVSFSEPVARLLSDVGIDGRFEAPASDGLMVATVNALGNKIDSFLAKNITYRGTVSAGRAEVLATISLSNGAPPSGLPDYVIGSFAKPAPARGTNRSTLLVYSALPATSVTVDGTPVSTVSTRTQGWWLHILTVELPPGGSSEIELHLEGDLPSTPYSLVLEPGGGANPEVYDVQVTASGRRITLQGRHQLRSVLK